MQWSSTCWRTGSLAGLLLTMVGCAWQGPPRFAPPLPNMSPPAMEGVPPVDSQTLPYGESQPQPSAPQPSAPPPTRRVLSPPKPIRETPRPQLADVDSPRRSTGQTIVRAQDPGYGNSGYGNSGYGGRSVGAVSPQARVAPNPPAYNNYQQYPPQMTPGQAAWQSNPPPSTMTPPPIYGAQPVPPAYNAPPTYHQPPPYTAGAPVQALPVNNRPGNTEVFNDPLNPVDPRSGLVTPMTGDKYIDIDAIVNETRTGRLMVGAGINSDAGLIGQIVIDEQNFDWRRFPTSWEDIRQGTAFRGGGQRFRIEAMPGTHVQRYSASFTEPYLFDSRVSLNLSGYLYDRRFYDWDEQRAGGRIGLGYQLPEDWSITGSLRGEAVEITNPRVLPPVPELNRVLGQNDLFTARVALVNDVRDSAFLPTQGHYVELAFEQAFGEFDFPMATLELRKYITLTQRIDGSGRHVLNLGGIFGVSGSDTPIFENFFAGGFSTLRGFQFRGASPRTGDVIVGGQMELLTTAEYMFPITADDMLRGVVFVDAGTVEKDVRFDADTFRVSPGVGLRIAHPGLGPAPIALDLAFPIAHDDGDKIRNFSFFIGIRR